MDATEIAQRMDRLHRNATALETSGRLTEAHHVHEQWRELAKQLEALAK